MAGWGGWSNQELCHSQLELRLSWAVTISWPGKFWGASNYGPSEASHQNTDPKVRMEGTHLQFVSSSVQLGARPFGIFKAI